MGSTPEVSILIYGLGAIGGTYAFFLSRAPNVSVSVVARSNYDTVKQHGMKIRSMKLGEHSFKAKNGTRRPECFFHIILHR